jgi:hypothetical protein
MLRGALYETRKQSVNCYVTTYNRVPATSLRRLLEEEYANLCVKRDVRPALRGITLRVCHAQYQEREREKLLTSRRIETMGSKPICDSPVAIYFFEPHSRVK